LETNSIDTLCWEAFRYPRRSGLHDPRSVGKKKFKIPGAEYGYPVKFLQFKKIGISSDQVICLCGLRTGKDIVIILIPSNPFDRVDGFYCSVSRFGDDLERIQQLPPVKGSDLRLLFIEVKLFSF
jgi:hypothetical protein